MMAAKASVLGLLLVSLVLGACTPEAVMPATLPPTRTVVVTETGMGTAVAEILVTAVPTAVTPTATATATRDPNQTTDLQTIERAPSTPAPTNTPRPTFTPSPTPTPVFLDLPEWVTDPAVNALLLGSYDDNETITLFNADTGEQFEIHVEVNELAPRWLWQEGNYFFSPQFPRDGQDVIDIETRELVRLANVNDDVRLVGSPDGRYVAHITREDRFDIVTLVDQETGLQTELPYPFQGSSGDDYYAYARAYWSPDGALLAVAYEKHYYDNFDLDLAIYTPSGELFREYANITMAWNDPWSPILPYRTLYIERGAPCILDITTNTRSCLGVATDWADNQNVQLYNFIWSPDSSKISFLHYSEEEGNNGLCYIELATEEIFCPITSDDLLLERQMVPRIHFWSPDGHYLALFFDDLWPGDVVGHVGGAVVNTDDQNLQILGREFSWPYNNPWRPSIPSPAQE